MVSLEGVGNGSLVERTRTVAMDYVYVMRDGTEDDDEYEDGEVALNHLLVLVAKR